MFVYQYIYEIELFPQIHMQCTKPSVIEDYFISVDFALLIIISINLAVAKTNSYRVCSAPFAYLNSQMHVFGW